MDNKLIIKRLINKKVSATLLLSDVLSMTVAFISALAISSFLQDYFGLSYYGDEENAYSFLSLIMGPLFLTLFYIKGHYTQRVPWWSQVRYIFGICVIAFVSDVFIRLVLDLPLSEFFITISSILLFFYTLVARQIVCFVFKRLGLWQMEAVIIGSVDTVTDILYAFHADYYVGYDVKTVILRDKKNKDLDLDSVPQRYKDLNILRDDIDYKEFIQSHLNSFFVVCLESFRGEERDGLIQKFTDNNMLYSVVPPTSSMSLFEMKPHDFFGYDIVLLYSRNNIFSIFGRLVKRSLDIVVSSLALLFISPIILAVAFFLKYEGQGGSIFYGGERVGQFGQKFKCWKFRSMQPDSDHLLHELIESDPEIKKEWTKFRKLKGEDPRVTTKTARLIRKSSIDELPQLWNVLVGDMSLVGPRPILEDEIELQGPSHSNYTMVRPGITGLWQVSGRNDTSFQRRVYMDDWYIRNWSIWSDIVILIKTLMVVLRGSGSY